MPKKASTHGARNAHALLLNPPLWNPYAPHLAVPLLLAMLRRHGVAATAIDLAAETTKYLLSAEGASEFAAWSDAQMPRTELLRFEAALTLVDSATAMLRSERCIVDVDSRQWATAVCQQVLRGITALVPGSQIDIDHIDLAYKPASSVAVAQACVDPVRNPYLRVFERVLAPRLRQMARLRVVGISVSADSQLIAALTAARIVKRICPETYIVLGGNFVTRIVPRLHADSVVFRWADSIVAYEGENAIVELVDRVLEDEQLGDVPGIVRPVDGHLRTTPARMVDLRALPVPDFTDYPLEDGYLAPGPVLPLISSRSCAWDCAFCAIPFASNKFRMRDAVTVADEMDELRRRHGIAEFQFVDEVLTVKALRELSEALDGRGHHWFGETRFSRGFDTRLTRRLYAAGCRRLELGLESLNQDVLDRMRKDIKIEWIGPNLHALLDAGIGVHLFTIAGFPGEARWQTARTVEFAEQTTALSRTVYGVDETTYGMGPFVLDALSPVATDPDSFEITVVHPLPTDDLQMGLSFVYRGNVRAPHTAEEQDVACRADEILLAPVTHDWPPEEVLFLRARDRARMRRPVRGVMRFPADWTQRHIRIRDRWVAYRRIDDAVIFMAPSTGALLTLPAHVVTRLPCTTLEAADTDAEIDQVRSALHHGCLAFAKVDTDEELCSVHDIGARTLLALAPAVTVGDRIGPLGIGARSLTSKVTQRTVQLSPAGTAAIEQIAQDGRVAYEELLARFGLDARSRVEAFVWRLLCDRLLILDAAPQFSLSSQRRR